ncbi:hypothetical protein Pint_36324 [Pistacia integerrima]|uniref:Uncharacterized protein n=1 Tax=Pistacia integerrima TaxID=434235 RepID=A0ACC0Y312_9ROSI|nr:hypothetical protein Pint_36324 [Pistacia integerrima]
MLQGQLTNAFSKSSSLVTLDLSHNQFNGTIPYWTDKLSQLNYLILTNNSFEGEEETIDVSWKNMSYTTYKGVTLTLIYGIDLSCNNLMGKIPPQIGNLTKIVTLNLSHNRLTGFIPKTFSNLKKIQSLDLSYNNLNGNIPPELVELNSLSAFNVAHNNLSGKTLGQTEKFITLGESSYEGNYFLCG